MDDNGDDDSIGSNKRTTLPLKEAIAKSISRGKLVSGGGANQSLSVPSFANPFYIEVMVLSKRLLTNSRRMPAKFAVRLGTIIVTGVVLCGFLVARDRLPKYWLWFHYISLIPGSDGMLCYGCSTVRSDGAWDVAGADEERVIGEHGACFGEEYNEFNVFNDRERYT
ncbi:ABC transporter G family member 6-like [Hibiscus syriacus]|nr:ABC transporter G family member 6-like [Hibiscus syriacus]